MTAPLPPVTVLKGGVSSEREISLLTGAGVAEALRRQGVEVIEYDVTSRDFLLPDRERVAFIALHGTFGEDGGIQDVLAANGIRYTGSGPAACRLAFDKLAARERFAAAGLRTARGGPWNMQTSWEGPYVLKPVADGSSVGVILVRSDLEEKAACELALSSGKNYMIEELIEGRELSVGVLDGRALPVIELRPHDGFYDYENKYTAGKTDHLCPAPLPDEVTARVRAAAETAHNALGCEVYSRIDFILPEDHNPVILEVNTHPGMTPLSLLPEMAGVDGISFGELCARIVRLSLEVRP